MSEVIDVIKVGISDIKVVKPPDLIRTSGLGSCVGIIIYNEKRNIASMAHVMLPDSSLARDKQFKAGKYANTAIAELFNIMKAYDAFSPLKAKIAGGAQMFQFYTKNQFMQIGQRNVTAVKQHLKSFEIELIAEDVGGNKGRTIEFNPTTFVLTVRKVNAETIEI